MKIVEIDNDSSNNKKQNIPILNTIPPHLNFCNEKIPINQNSIEKNLKKFFIQPKNKQNYLNIFAKAKRWFPVIEPILEQYQIPLDFKYLVIIESNFTNAHSNMQAAGFWQLVPGTATHFDLEISQQVDERLNVHLATHAACKIIKQAYKVFKNWTLAAAAYNVGNNALLHILKKQKQKNFYNLDLNTETETFIFKILAYKTLFTNPEYLGIKNAPNQFNATFPFNLVYIDTTINNLNNIANYYKCAVNDIKKYNVWLFGNTLINHNKRKYLFYIPKNQSSENYLPDLKINTFKTENDSINEI